MEEQGRKVSEWAVEKFNIIAKKIPIHGLKHHYFLDLEQPFKSRKYQNNMMETQINDFVQKTRQIINSTCFLLIEDTNRHVKLKQS
jgi:hypothetical protein